MNKPIMVDGVPHRRRRGRLVAIPLKWVGRVTSPQTINKRPSKMTAKRRHAEKQRKPEPPAEQAEINLAMEE